MACPNRFCVFGWWNTSCFIFISFSLHFVLRASIRSAHSLSPGSTAGTSPPSDISATSIIWPPPSSSSTARSKPAPRQVFPPYGKVFTVFKYPSIPSTVDGSKNPDSTATCECTPINAISVPAGARYPANFNASATPYSRLISAIDPLRSTTRTTFSLSLDFSFASTDMPPIVKSKITAIQMGCIHFLLLICLPSSMVLLTTKNQETLNNR